MLCRLLNCVVKYLRVLSCLPVSCHYSCMLGATQLLCATTITETLIRNSKMARLLEHLAQDRKMEHAVIEIQTQVLTVASPALYH